MNRLGMIVGSGALGMVGLCGEAGGVEQDGHGFLITHENSWVNDNRNPDLARNEIERQLLSAFWAERMIWSPGARDEDITESRIDSLARFTGPGRVLINLPDAPDRDDPFHFAAVETQEALVERSMEVEVIPEPWIRRAQNIEFLASYANHYVRNGAVISAAFGDRETDGIARNARARHYPGREIVMLNIDPLSEMRSGIFHYAIQQMPAL